MEISFCNGLRAILESELGLKVENYQVRNEDGKVFGIPDQIEFNKVVRDGKVIVGGEVKFYEEREGVKVDRIVLISSMVDPREVEVAKRVGIEIYTWLEEVSLD